MLIVPEAEDISPLKRSFPEFEAFIHELTSEVRAIVPVFGGAVRV